MLTIVLLCEFWHTVEYSREGKCPRRRICPFIYAV